jgi:hypothetical protein
MKQSDMYNELLAQMKEKLLMRQTMRNCLGRYE